jgi:hypothetical protein
MTLLRFAENKHKAGGRVAGQDELTLRGVKEAVLPRVDRADPERRVPTDPFVQEPVVSTAVGVEMSAAPLEHSEQFAAPASAQEVRRLRHRVAKTLADWGIADRSDDVLCSCAEMLANALAYGDTTSLMVQLAEQDGWLRLEVPDHNPRPPYLTSADPDDEDGRGVSLLATLADAWGFRAVGDGKSVFAEFRVNGC